MEAAATLPAPIARMTVAAPVTMSPPAQMRGSEVRPSFVGLNVAPLVELDVAGSSLRMG